MKTFYIEIERQGCTLAVIKVEAETEEEAKIKALQVLHAPEDIFSITEEEAKDMLDTGEIDYIVDEDGYEIGFDDDDDIDDDFDL